ncbi:MAG: hypothetical protein IPK35_18435 [Saprospiraceae bacterium]|jgi:hypothetical protein|nr:hypothetical protein [Saprospiraceae bacterium]
METIIIKAKKSKCNIIKDFLDKQNVQYEITSSEKEKKDESPYDPEFVEMVLKAKEGKSTRINPQNIWESIL